MCVYFFSIQQFVRFDCGTQNNFFRTQSDRFVVLIRIFTFILHWLPSFLQICFRQVLCVSVSRIAILIEEHEHCHRHQHHCYHIVSHQPKKWKAARRTVLELSENKTILHNVGTTISVSCNPLITLGADRRLSARTL